MLHTTLQDIRYSLRLLRRSPLFTITAALSLAIGIGANTTIFSIASTLLLRPLPGLTDQSRLVDVGRTQDERGFDNSSYPNFRDYRERQKSLTDVYACRLEPQPMSLATSSDAQRIYGQIVTANYFTILGVRPLRGRVLQDSDDAQDGSHAVVVLSHDLWTRTFGGDPSIVGQTISLNSKPFMVVGVAPAGFQGTTILKPDAWTPMAAMADTMPRIGADIVKNRAAVWLVMGGRLKDGVTIAQANAEAHAIGANLEKEYPDANRGKGLKVTRSALMPGQTVAVAGFLGFLLVIVALGILTPSFFPYLKVRSRSRFVKKRRPRGIDMNSARICRIWSSPKCSMTPMENKSPCSGKSNLSCPSFVKSCRIRIS